VASYLADAGTHQTGKNKEPKKERKRG